jgi:hypothetical protein
VGGVEVVAAGQKVNKPSVPLQNKLVFLLGVCVCFLVNLSRAGNYTRVGGKWLLQRRRLGQDSAMALISKSNLAMKLQETNPEVSSCLEQDLNPINKI